MNPAERLCNLVSIIPPFIVAPTWLRSFADAQSLNNALLSTWHMGSTPTVGQEQETTRVHKVHARHFVHLPLWMIGRKASDGCPPMAKDSMLLAAHEEYNLRMQHCSFPNYP